MDQSTAIEHDYSAEYFLEEENIIDNYRLKNYLRESSFPDTESPSPETTTSIPTDVQPIKSFTKKYGTIRETILAWWTGTITEIFEDECYFAAQLKDIDKGTRSILELDFDSVFNDEEDKNINLFVGAEFAFFVLTKHGSGRPETSSGIEFNSPHVWRKEDFNKVQEKFTQIFPEDPPLQF